MSLSRIVAEHVAAVRFKDLPTEAVQSAKQSLLDAIGVSLGASGLGEGVQAFIDLAIEAGGREEATILGVGRRVPMLMAALANGALAHALDFEDAHDGSLMHPNAQMVPALLAIAQARGLSGRDLLTAMAVGCDLACRLRLGCRTDPAELGWYPPAVFGAVGAAIGAAKLLGADAEQVIDALSWVTGPGAATTQTKYSPRSHFRAVRDGFAAHAGLLAARLAMGGAKGFDRPLEGKAGLFAQYGGGCEEAPILDGLGARFEGAFVSYKAWPACRGTHAFIEMATAMKAEGVQAGQIAAMTMTGGPIMRMLVEPQDQRLRPRTAIDAKFSVPFATALAFVRGEPTLADFMPDRLQDPAILDLAARSDWAIEADAGRPQPWGRLKVRLVSGEVLEREVHYPVGHPEKPLGWDRLADKFRGCAAYAQQPPSPVEIERLIAAVDSLDTAPDAGAALFPA